MRRRWFRTWVKWACTLSALVVVGAAAVSRFCLMRYEHLSPGVPEYRSISLSAGLLWWDEVDDYEPTIRQRYSEWTIRGSSGWYWGVASEDPGINTGMWRAGILWHSGPVVRKLGVSVVYPVLLITIPAAFLWYKDRRRFGPHACQKCGYDRRGLTANAACPECGTTPTPG